MGRELGVIRMSIHASARFLDPCGRRRTGWTAVDCLYKVLRKEPTFSCAPHTLCLGRWASRYSRYKSCCLNIHKWHRLPPQGHLVDLKQNLSLRSHHTNTEFFIKWLVDKLSISFGKTGQCPSALLSFFPYHLTLQPTLPPNTAPFL